MIDYLKQRREQLCNGAKCWISFHPKESTNTVTSVKKQNIFVNVFKYCNTVYFFVTTKSG